MVQKKWNGLIGLVLAVCMMITMAFGTSAQAAEESVSNREKIERFITSAYRFGLFNDTMIFDGGEWELCTPLVVYEVIGDGVSPTDTVMYPVMYDKTIVAFITEKDTLDGKVHTLTMDFNDVFNELPMTDKVAVIYDKTSVYLWNQREVSTLCDYGELASAQYRGTLADVSGESLQGLNTTAISTMTELAISTVSTCSDDTLYIILAVNKVLRQNNYCCWAACAESVLEKLYGIDYTQEGIASTSDNLTLNSQNVTLDKVRDAINKYTSLEVAMMGGVNTNTIFSNLRQNRPCIGAIEESGYIAHSVVIRGIDYESGTFLMMDPWTASYTMGSLIPISGSDLYSLRHIVGNVTYTISRMIYFM